MISIPYTPHLWLPQLTNGFENSTLHEYVDENVISMENVRWPILTCTHNQIVNWNVSLTTRYSYAVVYDFSCQVSGKSVK